MIQVQEGEVMTPEQFCYWLQGYFELSLAAPPQLNPAQTQVVKEHLALVFKKVTTKTTMTITDGMGSIPAQWGEQETAGIPNPTFVC